jgi:ferredoxin
MMFSDDMSSMSHEEFMDVICGVCARKATFTRKRDGKRSNKQKLGKLNPITDRILELIHTHHYSDYVIGSCPTVVCASCVLALEDAEKNGTEAKRKLLQPVPRAQEDAGLRLPHVPLVLGGQAEGAAVHHLLQVGEEQERPTPHQPGPHGHPRTCKIFLPTTSMDSLTSIMEELSRSLDPLSLC